MGDDDAIDSTMQLELAMGFLTVNEVRKQLKKLKAWTGAKVECERKRKKWWLLKYRTGGYSPQRRIEAC